MSKINFNQVQAPSFAESNALLELAMKQGNNALGAVQTGFTGAVDAVQNRNHAEIQALINSQSSEELAKPEVQSFLQKEFARIGGTGKMYDPTLANAALDARVDTLQGRDLKEGQIYSSSLGNTAQENTNTWGTINQVNKEKEFELEFGARYDEGLAKKLSSTKDLYASRILPLQASLSEAVGKKDLMAESQIRKEIESTKSYFQAEMEALGPIPAYVQDYAGDITRKQQEGIDAQGRLIESHQDGLKNTATNRQVAIETVANNAARTEIAGITAQAAITQRENASVANASKEDRKVLTDAAKTYGYGNGIFGADNRVDFNSLSTALKAKVSTAKQSVDKDDGVSFNAYVNGLKSNALNPAMMKEFNKVFAGTKVADKHKKGFLEYLNSNPGAADSAGAFNAFGSGWNYQSLYQKAFIKYKEETLSSGSRSRNDKAKEVYESTYKMLADLGYTPDEITKGLQLDQLSTDFKLLPQDLQIRNANISNVANKSSSALARFTAPAPTKPKDKTNKQGIVVTGKNNKPNAKEGVAGILSGR